MDEGWGEKDFVHTDYGTFSQVRGASKVKDFSYPQLHPQAVHKQDGLMHSLSTGGGEGGLGALMRGDYRSGIAVANVHAADSHMVYGGWDDSPPAVIHVRVENLWKLWKTRVGGFA